MHARQLESLKWKHNAETVSSYLPVNPLAEQDQDELSTIKPFVRRDGFTIWTTTVWKQPHTYLVLGEKKMFPFNHTSTKESN